MENYQTSKLKKNCKYGHPLDSVYLNSGKRKCSICTAPKPKKPRKSQAKPGPKAPSAFEQMMTSNPKRLHAIAASGGKTHSRAHLRAIGAKGGNALKEKYGNDYFKNLSAKSLAKRLAK